ncbi:MAG: hypothetical protein ABIL02_07045 [candidate division WOR-3 bacterium]
MAEMRLRTLLRKSVRQNQLINLLISEKKLAVEKMLVLDYTTTRLE